MPDWTPGPWTLAPNGDLLGPDGEELILSGVQLSINGTPAEKSEAAANTRLLWAAPDLLAACEEAIAEARERDEDMGMNCWPAMIAAVAKAKGETSRGWK